MFRDYRDPRHIARTKRQDGESDFAYASRLEGLCRQLAEELACMQGQIVTPQRGCFITEACLGDATVLVEYEYLARGSSRQEDPTFYDDIEIIQMFVNGIWTDPRDVLSEKVIERWEQQIRESHWQMINDRKHAAIEAHCDYLREERLLEEAK